MTVTEKEIVAALDQIEAAFTALETMKQLEINAAIPLDARCELIHLQYHCNDILQHIADIKQAL